MNKKKVFISGPISNRDIEDTRVKFAKAEEKLMSAGYTVINPIKKVLPDYASYHEHMKRDIANLLLCDCIYMLQGWEDSHGAALERHIAMAFGIEILYEHDRRKTT